MKKNPIYESLIDKSIGSMLSAIVEIFFKEWPGARNQSSRCQRDRGLWHQLKLRV